MNLNFDPSLWEESVTECKVFMSAALIEKLGGMDQVEEWCRQDGVKLVVQDNLPL